MPARRDTSSETPFVEIGEEDILIEESWLDCEWASMLATEPQLPSATGGGQLRPAILATSSSTAHAMLACTVEIEGLLLAVVLEPGGARVLVDDGAHRQPGTALPALASLWNRCLALALDADEPLDELLIRSECTLLAYRRVTGTENVLCVLLDRCGTNEALARLNMTRLCGRAPL